MWILPVLFGWQFDRKRISHFRHQNDAKVRLDLSQDDVYFFKEGDLSANAVQDRQLLY